MATKVASRPKRVSRISVLLRFWTVRKPISGRNSPKASSAVQAASRSARATSMRVFGAALMSDLLDVRAPEQALRQEDQRDNQNAERRHVLVVDGKIRRPHRLDKPDEEP